jgi:hypothetical protein
LRFGEYSEDDILMKLCEKHQWPLGTRSDVAICIQLASRHRANSIRRYAIPSAIIPPMNHSIHAPRHAEAKAEDDLPLSQVRHVEDGQADAHRLDPNYLPPSPTQVKSSRQDDTIVDDHIPAAGGDTDRDDTHHDTANDDDYKNDEVMDDNDVGISPSTGSFLTPFRAPAVEWSDKFPNKYYMWSNDFHPSPLVCNAPLFTENGMVIHAEIDFGHCIVSNIHCYTRT